MRKRTILGVAAAGIAAFVLYRRRNQLPISSGTREVSPIDEPVPGDESIDREDVPSDVSEEEIPAGVDQGSETLSGEEGNTESERASKDPDRSVEEDAEAGGSSDESGSGGGSADEGEASGTESE